MRLSARVRGLSESATMRVVRRAAELAAQGVDVIDLSAAEPDFDSPASAVAAAKKALDNGFTKYTPAAGLPKLREAVAAHYRARYAAPWKAADTLITVGAKGALFETALALFEAGDEVILHTPAWVSFAEQVRFTGAKLVEVPTDAADGFAIRAEPLLEAVTPHTRAVIVNTPCNPTGGVIAADELRRLVAGCAARGITVIADEVYERFVYEGEHASAAALAADFPETVVLIGAFSKTYAMTGWRLGYLLGPRPIVDAVGKIQSHATSNPTSFAMVGALAALAEADGDVAQMLAEYRARREQVVARLNELPGVRCAPPAGAMFVFPEVADWYRPGRADSHAFAEWLLEEAKVAVVAGDAFGADRHVRISFASSRQQLARGFDRIAELLARTPR